MVEGLASLPPRRLVLIIGGQMNGSEKVDAGSTRRSRAQGKKLGGRDTISPRQDSTPAHDRRSRAWSNRYGFSLCPFVSSSLCGKNLLASLRSSASSAVNLASWRFNLASNVLDSNYPVIPDSCISQQRSFNGVAPNGFDRGTQDMGVYCAFLK